jgi:RNA polymerase sigma factor (sigma-70 family)
MVVWRRWADFDGGRPLRPWLAGIAARVARDFLKRRRREVPHGDVEVIDPDLVGEEQIEAARARKMVLAVLAGLPDRHRLAIVLHDFQGLPPHDVAQAMGVPVSTAYTRLRRAHLAFAREVARLRRRRTAAPALLRAPDSRRVIGVGLAAAFALSAVALLAGPWPQATARLPGARPAIAAPVRAPATRGLPRRGLVGYWPLDDAPGSTVARDQSGHGHDCLLHELDPRRAWTGGALGGAIDLRAGGWLECPQPALPAGQVAPDMTVMVRVKAALDQEAHSAVVTRETGTGHDDLFFFGFVGERLKVSSRAWLGWVSRPVPDGRDRWMHIAFARRARGPTRLFLDGVEVGENEQGERLVAGDRPTPLMVGGGHVGFDGSQVRQHFAGVVDDLAVYDRALEPEEIAQAAALAPPTL